MKFFKPFPLPTPPVFPARTLDVRDYGAVQDTDISRAIRAAIEECAALGGGRVLIPQGHYITGPIHLRSNIDLHFAKGCRIEFSSEFNDYLPPVFGVLAGNRCYSPSHLIYAHRANNIAVTGEGVLDGHGEAWWHMKQHQPGMEDLVKKGKALSPIEERTYDKPEDGVRPRMLQFVECENILIEGITLKNSPSWCIHPVMCGNITIRNLTIRNPKDSPNTDGIDLEFCNRGLIEHCDVEGGDDMICLKAGRDADGRAVAIPCRDIEVRYCRNRSSRGGLTIGSEMSAGVQNAYIHDCTLGKLTAHAIRLKTMKGRGGVVENIDIENVTVEETALCGISITMRYTAEPLDDQSAPLHDMPTVRNIAIRNFKTNRSSVGIELVGERKYELENISLSDMSISSPTPLVVKNVNGLSMENMHFIEL